jgi:exopolysaccharide biosynthesis protein
MAIGATDALNLDGGGSSTFVLKLGAKYATINRPSDGSDRAVDNAWMVMYKNN